MTFMDAKSKQTLSSVRAAIYARVSSEQQSQQCTIDSQIALLKDRVEAEGLFLDDELHFIDDGYSGSTLVRPALERMRDVAWAGGFTRLYVQSPDRLARKYAWQVLLLEELQRSGIELVFLNRTIGVSPEEDLLLQMQGMIAEYERAKIMERSRRGKRHAARRGSVNVLVAAPYGYRYITKHAGGGQAQYQVVFEEARVVKQMFEWVGRDRIPLREVGRRLRKQNIRSAKGKSWHVFTVRKLLTNPAYQGGAIFGKTRVGERRPQLRPARGKPEHPRRNTARYPGAAEDQFVIPVTAIISAELFDTVADQIAENRKRHRQQVKSPGYLLQGLIVCGCCGYGWYGKGISRFTKNDQAPYPYYRCIGMDASRFGGTKVCQYRPIRLDRLDAAVWTDVCSVLQNPRALQEEFERRLGSGNQPDMNLDQLQKQIYAVQRSISRLIDAYEDGLLQKNEFEPRVAHARERLERLQQEHSAVTERAAQRQELRLVLSHLDEFANQVREGLDGANFETRKEIIRSLVKTIKIEEENVRITYRIVPRPFADGPSGGKFRQHCHHRVQRHPAGDQYEGEGGPFQEGEPGVARDQRLTRHGFATQRPTFRRADVVSSVGRVISKLVQDVP
jgi:site-specific DNA recombinase